MKYDRLGILDQILRPGGLEIPLPYYMQDTIRNWEKKGSGRSLQPPKVVVSSLGKDKKLLKLKMA
jgi:hypothetical protein